MSSTMGSTNTNLLQFSVEYFTDRREYGDSVTGVDGLSVICPLEWADSNLRA